MDGRSAGNAAKRSGAGTPPERRRRELVELLGHGLARVVERSPSEPEALSDSCSTRVELPGDAGLSVATGVVCPRRGGSR